jgi:hypothetical protein
VVLISIVGLLKWIFVIWKCPWIWAIHIIIQ